MKIGENSSFQLMKTHVDLFTNIGKREKWGRKMFSIIEYFNCDFICYQTKADVILVNFSRIRFVDFKIHDSLYVYSLFCTNL